MFKPAQAAVALCLTVSVSPLVYAASLDKPEDSAPRPAMAAVSPASLSTSADMSIADMANPMHATLPSVQVVPAEVTAQGCLPGFGRVCGFFRTAFQAVQPITSAILRAVARNQHNPDLERAADIIDDIARRADPVLEQASHIHNAAGLVNVAVAGATTGLAIAGEHTGDRRLSVIGGVVQKTGGALEEGVRRIEVGVASGAGSEVLAREAVAAAAGMSVEVLSGVASVTGNESVAAAAHEVADISHIVGLANESSSSAKASTSA